MPDSCITAGPESITDFGNYHFTDLAYAGDAAILMSDQLQADRVLQSFNAFAAILGLNYRGQRQNSKTWVQVTRRRQSS